MLRRLLFSSILVVSIWSLVACGKFGPPLPPSAYSAEAVQALAVEGSTAGVQLSWRTPELDRRGEELQDLNRFEILRTEVSNLGEFIRSPIDNSELIGEVRTDNIINLEKKREQARANKKSSRNIKLTEAEKKFEYIDKSAVLGASYIYSIVPYGSSNVAGALDTFARVDFNGNNTVARIFTIDAFNRPYSIELAAETPDAAVDQPVEDQALADSGELILEGAEDSAPDANNNNINN